MKEFLRLDNKLFIKLKIKPLSPLTIKLATESEETKKSTSISALLTTESFSIIKKDDNNTNNNNKEKEIIIKNGKFEQDKRKGEIYIPGSTLKGLFRDKFIEIYGSEDDIDKVFGYINKTDENKALKSKFFIEDAYFKEEKRMKFYNENIEINKITKLRAITPIDHFSGKVVAPLQIEYTREEFVTDLIINNVNLKELQTIYFIIRDSLNGEIRIGNSKTRGFGQVEFSIDNLILERYLGKDFIFEKDEVNKFFKRDEEKSIKIGDNYLRESLKLKEEYKNIDTESPNEFIKCLFKEVK